MVPEALLCVVTLVTASEKASGTSGVSLRGLELLELLPPCDPLTRTNPKDYPGSTGWQREAMKR